MFTQRGEVCNRRNFVYFSFRGIIMNPATCYCNFSLMRGISNRCAMTSAVFGNIVRIIYFSSKEAATLLTSYILYWIK